MQTVKSFYKNPSLPSIPLNGVAERANIQLVQTSKQIVNKITKYAMHSEQEGAILSQCFFAIGPT